MSDIKIMVVTHKEASMPNNKKLYVPTLVGQNKEKILNVFGHSYCDDDGENIAKRNPSFCELTAMYWAWKNLEAEYVGLVHYRRVFMSPADQTKVIGQQELETLFRDVDILLPKKRNYYIETTYSHFEHNHNIADLLETRKIIKEKFPAYITAFDRTMKYKKSHRFNMMIMKQEKFSDYCEWLFSILFELENRVDISKYDPYQSRLFGFISERLLDVWIETTGYPYKELPYKFTEKQNWLKKGSKFLLHKMKIIS